VLNEHVAVAMAVIIAHCCDADACGVGWHHHS